MQSEVVMVERIIGNDELPIFKMSFKFIPNPNKITAYCKIFLEVKVIPS